MFLGLATLLPAGALVAAPAIGVNPDRAAVTLAPGQSQTQALTIANSGSDPLNWSILNQNTQVRDFRREAALTLNPSDYFPVSGVVDPNGRYAYFGTSTPPGQLIKVDLQTLERVGTITMPDAPGEEGEKFLFSGVVDPAGQYAYFGTGTYPAKVIKVDLERFRRVGAITMESGEDVLRSAVMDPAGRFAYFGSDTDPAHIIKIDLATFQRVGAIELDPSIPYLDTAAVIDPLGQFAYFGISWGSIVKINLSNFTLVDTLDTGVGTLLASALMAPTGQYAYFGTYDAPGRILRLDLATFSVNGTLTLEPGEDRPAAAVMSTDGNTAYFGTRQTNPGRVVKVDLPSFTRTGALTLNPGENDLRAAVMDKTSGNMFFAAATFPGRVVKVSDTAYNCALPSWASVTPGSGTIAAGTNQAVTVGFNATGLGVGRHTAAACLQSNDPAQPRVAVPLVAEVRLTDVAPQTFAFDLVRGGGGSDNLSIANRGSGALAWTITQADPVQGCSVPSTSAWLNVTPTSGTVASGNTANVAVEITSSNVADGPYAAQLCLSASSGGNTQKIEIPVKLTVRAPAPTALVTPTDLAVTLPSGQSGNWDVSILNLGEGALNWNLLNENIAPSVNDTLVLNSGEYIPSSSVIDAAGRYAYFGTAGIPAQIIKVDLSTFQRVAAITLATGENAPRAAVIDPSGRYAYFGAGALPARVVKIDLASFQRVGAITLGAGEDSIGSAVIDPAGAFAYFGTLTELAKVVKINLATFTRVGAIDLDSSQDESYLKAAVIDPAGAFAYFATGPLVGKAVKIDLASFQRVGSITLVDDQGISAAVIDASGRYAYFGSEPPFFGISQMIKVDLASFQPVGAADLDIGNYEGGISAAVIDPHGRYILAGTTWGSATRMAEIDLKDFYRVGPVMLGVVEGGLRTAVIDPNGRFAYFGSQLYPGQPDHGRVLKIEGRMDCSRPNWLTVGTTSGSVPPASGYDLDVGASTNGLSLGAHTANLCIASDDPLQPLLGTTVELTVTAAGDRIFANGFDPVP